MKKKLTFMIVGGLVAITFIFAPLLHKHLSNKKTPINNIELEDKSSFKDSSSKKNVEKSSDNSIEVDKKKDYSNNTQEKTSNSSDDNIDSTNSFASSNKNKAVVKPISPSDNKSKPVVKPASPSDNRSKPVVKPASPSDNRSKPVVKPASPSDNRSKPVVKPTSPSDNRSKPVVKPASPSDNRSKPVVKPASSSDNRSKPVVKPASPSDNRSKPVVKPASSSDNRSKSVVKPASPSDNRSKPVVKPASPSDNRSKPVVKPASPSDNRSKPTPSKSNSPSFEEVQQAIFKLVNKERIKAGKPEYSYDRTMEKYAIMKSKDMSVRNYFDHQNPEGKFINDIMDADGVKYMAFGENIAYRSGQINVDELAKLFMEQWMNSPPHRANILDNKFKNIGVGLYRIGNTVYATQEFCKY